MVMPTIEWPNEGNSGNDKLNAILAQRFSVSEPAFQELNSAEMEQFLTTKPHMTDAEQMDIFNSIRTPELTRKVSEAVERVKGNMVTN